MTDLRPTIVPKSDQMNADDLIGGPVTITVTRVALLSDPDQPVAIHYEGEDGRPFKPCKSMRRVLVLLWGDDGHAYAGRSMTLYRDPKIRFGKDEVGGIRISHLSHIKSEQTLALTVTRGSRKPYTVRPLAPGTVARSEPVESVAALTEAGRKAAAGGEVALQAWWKTLSTAQKVLAKPVLDTELKPLAKNAGAPGYDDDPPKTDHEAKEPTFDDEEVDAGSATEGGYSLDGLGLKTGAQLQAEQTRKPGPLPADAQKVLDRLKADLLGADNEATLADLWARASEFRGGLADHSPTEADKLSDLFNARYEELTA